MKLGDYQLHLCTHGVRKSRQKVLAHKVKACEHVLLLGREHLKEEERKLIDLLSVPGAECWHQCLCSYEDRSGVNIRLKLA